MMVNQTKELFQNNFCDTAAILAGGKSMRMGRDKQGLKFADGYLVFKLIEQLQCFFAEIIVVTKTPELYLGQNVLLTEDILPSLGPMSGLHAALSLSSSPYLYLTACDMPFFDPALPAIYREKLNSMQALSGIALEREVRGRDNKLRLRPETFHAVYARELLDELEVRILSGQSRIETLMHDLNFYFLKEEEVRQNLSDPSIFTNINSPADAEAAGLKLT